MKVETPTILNTDSFDSIIIRFCHRDLGLAWAGAGKQRKTKQNATTTTNTFLEVKEWASLDDDEHISREIKE